MKGSLLVGHFDPAFFNWHRGKTRLLVGPFGLFPLACCERKKAGLLVGPFVHDLVVVNPLLAERPVHAQNDRALARVYNLALLGKVLHAASPAEPGGVVLDLPALGLS